MLVFLAADERAVADLEQAEAEHLAWASVVAESDALGLSRQQEDQAKDRLGDAKSTVELRLVDAYQWLLVPRQPEPTQPPVWDEVKVDGAGSLPERAARKLMQTGGLYVVVPAGAAAPQPRRPPGAAVGERLGDGEPTLGRLRPLPVPAPAARRRGAARLRRQRAGVDGLGH